MQLDGVRTNYGFYALFNADLNLLRSITNEMGKTPDLSNFMLGFYLLNFQYANWFDNDLNGVIREADKVLAVKYEFTSRLVVDCYVMKALALEALGNSELANMTIHNAMGFAKHIGDPANISVVLSGKARLDLAQENLDQASDWLESTEFIPLNPTILWCVEVSEFTRCRVLLKRGSEKDLNLASELLKEYEKFVKSTHNNLQTIEVLTLEALVYSKLRNREEAQRILQEALDLAETGEWVRPFAEQYDGLKPILKSIKDEGYNIDFISRIESRSKTLKDYLVRSKDSGKADLIPSKELLNVITPREMKVLEYIAEGLRNQEIADRLFNSEQTIKKHISNMLQKMNVKNRISLIIKAKEEGILE